MAPLKKRRGKKGMGWTKKRRGEKKGFNAFEVKEIVPIGKRTVQRAEVVSPETGIHSLEWAQNITPQPSLLLGLPIEIRHTIYTYALNDEVALRPLKHGDKFTSSLDINMIKLYLALSQVSRQVYVDVVGGGFLHRLASFNFTSPNTMHNYLSRINPSHRDLIQTVVLQVRISYSSPKIARKVFRTLGSLPNLESLKVELVTSCHPGGPLTLSQTMATEQLMGLKETWAQVIGAPKSWEPIQGLREFALGFKIDGPLSQWTYPWPGRISKFDSKCAAFVSMTDRIMKVVMKK